MNNKAQLLLVSGLLMSITLIAVTSSISHSVNIGSHQGEKHDITPIISSLENSFPLALEHEVILPQKDFFIRILRRSCADF